MAKAVAAPFGVGQRKRGAAEETFGADPPDIPLGITAAGATIALIGAEQHLVASIGELGGTPFDLGHHAHAALASALVRS